ncbi:MAG TPA: hypothetical protein VGD58_31445, partial [Herpetosiphonaceae bacterium]
IERTKEQSGCPLGEGTMGRTKNQEPGTRRKNKEQKASTAAPLLLSQWEKGLGDEGLELGTKDKGTNEQKESIEALCLLVRLFLCLPAGLDGPEVPRLLLLKVKLGSH